jgi:hypothetical protein
LNHTLFVSTSHTKKYLTKMIFLTYLILIPHTHNHMIHRTLHLLTLTSSFQEIHMIILDSKDSSIITSKVFDQIDPSLYNTTPLPLTSTNLGSCTSNYEVTSSSSPPTNALPTMVDPPSVDNIPSLSNNHFNPSSNTSRPTRDKHPLSYLIFYDCRTIKLILLLYFFNMLKMKK